MPPGGTRVHFARCGPIRQDRAAALRPTLNLDIQIIQQLMSLYQCRRNVLVILVLHCFQLTRLCPEMISGLTHIISLLGYLCHFNLRKHAEHEHGKDLRCEDLKIESQPVWNLSHLFDTVSSTKLSALPLSQSCFLRCSRLLRGFARLAPSSAHVPPCSLAPV